MITSEGKTMSSSSSLESKHSYSLSFSHFHSFFGEDCGEYYTDPYEMLGQELFELGYKYLGRGRHRAAFLTPNGRFVVKIPLYNYAESQNEAEYHAWLQGDKTRLAKCRLFWRHSIPCIIMEAVKKMSMYERAKLYMSEGYAWIKKVDYDGQGYQVGRNRKGMVVAWDYTDGPI